MNNGKYDYSNFIKETYGMDINGYKTGTNETILIHWIKKGNKYCCKWLMDDKDVNINKKDRLGKTPLMWACEYNRPNIVKILLKKLMKLNWIKCSICDDRKKNTHVKLKCNHYFHKCCINKWEKNM